MYTSPQLIQIEQQLRGGYLSTGTKYMRQQLVSNPITPFIVDLSSPKILLARCTFSACAIITHGTLVCQNFTPLLCDKLS